MVEDAVVSVETSEPIYRSPAQLGLIALILGAVLGLVGIVMAVIPQKVQTGCA